MSRLRRLPPTVRIVGCGMTGLNPRPVPRPSRLMHQALDDALQHADMTVNDLDGIIAVPSLADPKFMVVLSC